MKPVEKLLLMIPHMKTIEFAGLARVLKVKLIEENKDSTSEEDKYVPRNFTDVLDNVLQNFEQLNRSQKREVLNLIKASNKVTDAEMEEMINAYNSKHTNTESD